jgi:hypothetical protein
MTDIKVVLNSPYFREPLDCRLEVGKYANQRVALQLYDANDGEPVAKATVNVIDWEPETPAHTLIKDWSENVGVLQSLVDAEIIELTGKEVACGFEFAQEAIITRLDVLEAIDG